jgi:hypothetical protein
MKETIEAELVPAPQHLGLIDSALELALREDGGEVEEGAGDGGDRDAVVDGDLVGWEAGLVDLDAVARAHTAPWNGDLAWPTAPHDLPVRPSGPMAQNRAGP